MERDENDDDLDDLLLLVTQFMELVDEHPEIGFNHIRDNIKHKLSEWGYMNHA